MNKYIFTFGAGQQYEGFYQPIYAKTWSLARREMFLLHGEVWSAQYTETEWKDAKKLGFAIEHPLEAICCDEV